MGQADQFQFLPLDLLYSPKASIMRDHRYIRDTEYRTVVLGRIPPAIDVEPILDPKELGRLTPLAQVVLA